MRIYIAGPMQGYVNFNYDSFDVAEQAIRSMGYTDVINPANNFNRRQDLSYSDYLDKALEQVATADLIVKLPGWEASWGVSQEMKVAFDRQIEHTTFEAFTGQVGPRNEPDDTTFLPDEECPCYRCQGTDEEQVDPISDPRITDEAWSLVVEGDRQTTYGHPTQDFRTTGRQWGALIENWLVSQGYVFYQKVEGAALPTQALTDFPDIPPKLVALMMAALKASRESQAPKRDNRVDGIGYWLCADRIEEDY